MSFHTTLHTPIGHHVPMAEHINPAKQYLTEATDHNDFKVASVYQEQAICIMSGLQAKEVPPASSSVIALLTGVSAEEKDESFPNTEVKQNR